MKTIGRMLGTAFLAVLLGTTPARGDDGSKPAKARAELRVSVKDPAKGLDFELHTDGHVELTVKEEKDGKTEDRTYKADSMDDFRKKYPDVAKKYQIERFLPRVEWRAIDPRTSERAFEEWKRWFQEDWFWDREAALPWFRDWWRPRLSDDLDNWVEKQRKLFEQFRNLDQPKDPADAPSEAKPTAGPAFGIRIDEVDEVLSAHTQLKRGEGALVMAVDAGSPAEKAGLKVHDIVLRIDDDPVTDCGAFRRTVKARLSKGFKLLILRKGKQETVEVSAVPG